MIEVGRVFIIKMERGLDYCAEIEEIFESLGQKFVKFGNAVVLRNWGTSHGMGELLTNAQLGKYDPVNGWIISPKYIQAYVPIVGEMEQAWRDRLRIECTKLVST